MKKVIRIVFGVVLLALFAFYMKTALSSAPHADDLRNGADVEPVVVTVTVTPAAPVEVTPEPTPEPTVDPESPAGRAAALGLPAPPDIDINSWEYVLVNRTHTIDETFAPETVFIADNCNVDVRIQDYVIAFTDAAKAQGLPVYLTSGYRSYATQQSLLNNKLTQYSYDVAITIVAPPGTSEHQTGLACDIIDHARPYMNAELEDTDTYKWMSAHCQEYGFIVRYPLAKSGEGDSITGIIYEPWHFRYVGVEAATYMEENDLCLEEFVALYTGEAI